MHDLAWRVAFEPPRGEIELGDRGYPVRHRALVMGVMTSDDSAEAERLIADGAALVQLPRLTDHRSDPSIEEETSRLVASVEALRPLGVPVVVDTSSAEVLGAALAAGAVVASDTTGTAGPDHLAVAATAGASVVLSPSQLEAAERAGIPAGRILVDVDLEREEPSPGWSWSVSADDEARWSLAIALGARVLRTSEVRRARRVADVMAAVLEARRP